MAGSVLAETVLLDLPLDAVARHRVDAVDEEDAVEVVDLVLQDPRAQAARELPGNLLSFMNESRRLVNRRVKEELRLRLRYPTVDDGIADALDARRALAVRADN